MRAASGAGPRAIRGWHCPDGGVGWGWLSSGVE